MEREAAQVSTRKNFVEEFLNCSETEDMNDSYFFNIITEIVRYFQIFTWYIRTFPTFTELKIVEIVRIILLEIIENLPNLAHILSFGTVLECFENKIFPCSGQNGRDYAKFHISKNSFVPTYLHIIFISQVIFNDRA